MLTTRAIIITRLFVMALLTVVWWFPRKAHGAPTPAFVQEADGSKTSGPSVSAAFSSANMSGNLIVLHVIWDNMSTVSVSDSAGNRYASAVGPTRYNNRMWSAQLFYATNIVANANSVTVTFGTSLRSFGIVHAVEYSGLAASGPLDVTAAASGTARSMSSGSVTTKNAADLLFGAGANSGSMTTAGSGFTARYLSSGSITEDRNVTAVGSYSATATQNGSAWVMQLATFKAVIADTVPPSVPTKLSATAASSSQINLAWSASSDNVGVAGYKVYRSGVQMGTTTATSYSDTGLAASTKYSYTVAAFDAAGNTSSRSATATATTQAAPTPATIGSFAASPPSTTRGQSSTLSWAVSNATSLTLDNGIGPVTGTSLSVTPATTTTYTLTATNSSGVTTAQTTVSVVPDTQAPTVPANLIATAVSSSQINLAWAACGDNVGVAGFMVYRGGVQIGTTTATSYSDTGLVASTIYSYTVAAFDAAGNVSALSAVANATTLDTTAPTVPVGLSAAAVSSSQINLSWTASTDVDNASSQLTYGVYRNNIRIATTTAGTTSWNDTGLAASTTYAYAVNARDPAGNSSAGSASVNVTTLAPPLPIISSFGANPSSIIAGQTTTLSWVVSSATYLVVDQGAGVVIGTASTTVSPATTTVYTLTATNNAGSTTAETTVMVSPDTEAPTVPANLAAAAVAPSQINLAWTPSTDNVAVTGYEIYRSGLRVGTSTATTYSDSGLPANTAYTYAVAAFDAAGNLSALSAEASATTLGLPLGNYATTFPLAEDAISEGGSWLNGAAVGLDWRDIRTTSGFACGTQTGNTEYDDSIANLRGSWGPNQMAQATVRIVSSDSAQFEEVELHLRRSLSAHTATGYEILFSVKPGNPYVQIVRWNGALGDWTQLNGIGLAVKDGDVVAATIVGNAITACINGIKVLQASDGTYTTGSPGMGFYLQNGTSDLNSNFGFATFMASDGSAPDTQAPSVPANLAATAGSPSQINLAWTASTDNVGVAGYQIYRNGVAVGTTSATTYSDVGLDANTTYTYGVAAFDAAGTVSAPSATASATTPPPDMAPPSVPSNLQAPNVVSSSVTITWSPSTDNVAVAGYLVFRNGNQVGTTTLTNYSDTGLVPSTTYIYAVAAYDASTNVSAQSGQLVVTTTAAASKPPSFVQVNNNQIASGTSTAVSFKSLTQAGNTIVAYVIWSNTGNVALTDTRGDSFVSAASPVAWGANYRAQVFYAANITGGTDAVTATFQNAVSSFGVVYIHEYSGINPLNPVDVTVAASGASGSLNSGTVTTTLPNDLIFGAGVSDNSVTAAGSGFTARSTAYGNITEDCIATSTGSYNATASQNGRAWGMQMIAFRSAN